MGFRWTWTTWGCFDGEWRVATATVRGLQGPAPHPADGGWALASSLWPRHGDEAVCYGVVAMAAGEQDHLVGLGDLADGLERCGAAVWVEVDQRVVQKQGRAAVGPEHIDECKPGREEDLLARGDAHWV